MKFTKSFLAIPVAAVTLLGSVTVAQQDADIVLVNGNIVTVDDYFSIQEAVAIRGERIAAVGSNNSIRDLAGPQTQIVDLGVRGVVGEAPAVRRPLDLILRRAVFRQADRASIPDVDQVELGRCHVVTA